ncbi:endonuclease/exonuclease/phosphatase family protein [Parasedimentitalea psychrophila]|uniref:Endonuclease/exonuclease/phosphatase family protein n=1 Tax=Parasedimentitalea psychrophila TaxID=2997337 RepID=A0A9Y2L253_9RHOB|nr:endonuclease/exonuclease/phosphatase family protein [Parasedimentitalea psychrophila]WIY26590.1 endonuclease/exonuclease/phosphatase family protein [Parasedimentitalea psychrophila]
MRGWAAGLLLLFFVLPVHAETLRIATFNTEMSRQGPGLLLRDIERDKDPQISAVVAQIASVNPDILVLQGIDWDYENRALQALQLRLQQAGAAYPYVFARQPNSGMASDLDLDGDGRLGGARDSQGYGSFTGAGGNAVLSRLPIDHGAVRDLSPLLWRDLPGALLPQHPDGTPFPSPQALQVQRLSSTSHWLVPLKLPDGGSLTLLIFQATPPLFDGPEDRNGRRNADEIRLWQLLLDGALGAAPAPPLVIAGGANLDPNRGAGRRAAIAALLADRRLQDPRPSSPEAGVNTVEWQRAGRMRVDYLLPSADLQVLQGGVLWPATSDQTATPASRHHLVWLDLALAPQ